MMLLSTALQLEALLLLLLLSPLFLFSVVIWYIEENPSAARWAKVIFFSVVRCEPARELFNFFLRSLSRRAYLVTSLHHVYEKMQVEVKYFFLKTAFMIKKQCVTTLYNNNIMFTCVNCIGMKRKGLKFLPKGDLHNCPIFAWCTGVFDSSSSAFSYV